MVFEYPFLHIFDYEPFLSIFSFAHYKKLHFDCEWRLESIVVLFGPIHLHRNRQNQQQKETYWMLQQIKLYTLPSQDPFIRW